MEQANIPQRKVRIIFRGLVLFRFEQSGGEQRARALLINDPASSGVHHHTPRLGIIGRDARTNAELLGHRRAITDRRISIEFSSTRFSGLEKDSSIDDYVPKLSEVYGGAATRSPDNQLVAAEVIVPAGRIRAKSLVSWTHDVCGRQSNRGAETPMPLQFFWNPAWGPRLVASECVLEAPIEVGGDGGGITIRDTAMDDRREDASYSRLPERIRVLAESGFRDELEPNTIDILITCFGPQRAVSVPWSLHYQWFFRAAGYEGRPFDEDQLNAFVDAAEGFSSDEWMGDAMMLDREKGLPIPHLKDLVPALAGAGCLDRSAVPLADPLNRPICPPALDDGG